MTGKEKHQFNLPLLFANGSLTSLESMNLFQLQRFLLFLLSCEQGHKVFSLDVHTKPAWWPEDVEFGDRILENSSKKGMWSLILRRTIEKCYRHHKAESLLKFSRQLKTLTEKGSAGSFEIVENGDGTRSMKSVATQKILVTFKDENQDYDRNSRNRPTSFSTLSPMKGPSLLSLSSTNSNNNNTSDPTLPRCSDVYLCDICGEDFESLHEVLAHEKECKSPLAMPAVEPEVSMQHFFGGLQLKPVVQPEASKGASSLSESAAASYKPISYDKFLSIDLTSPLGRYISRLVQGSRAGNGGGTKEILKIRKSNGHVSRRVSSRVTKFRVTYRGYTRDKLRQSPHMYCFNKAQRAIRLQTIQTGLSLESLNKLRSLSKRPLEVKIEPLPCKNPLAPSREEIQKMIELSKQQSSNRNRQFNDDNLNVIVPKLLPVPDTDLWNSTSSSTSPKVELVDSPTGLTSSSSNTFYQKFMYSGQFTDEQEDRPEAPTRCVQIVDLCSTDGEEEEPISDSTFSSDMEEDDDVSFNFQRNIPVQNIS